MSYANYKQLTDLRYLLADLGKQGGLISPSVYDTAQVLRFMPPNEQSLISLGWLLAQQHPDGGWGDPAAPRARDLPTLATILALQPYTAYADCRAAINIGLTFLRDHAPQQWGETIPDDIVIAAELLIPQLVNEATNQGLDVPRESYAALFAMGERRRQLIARITPEPGSAPAYSWEGWGTQPDSFLIDASGGIGHSPAATAVWLRCSAACKDLLETRIQAQHYLERASAATCLNLPGVVPTVWPINRFEYIWGLYALFIAGLLEHPHLHDVVRPQLDDLYQALRPGIGITDAFMQDGDSTATALATLKAAGYSVDSSILKQFQRDDHFITYPHELHLSLTATAHAVLALALCDEDVSRPVQFLLSKREPDGRWVNEKWHSSWLYTTAQIVTALAYANQIDAIEPTIDALMRYQHVDGGWGMSGCSTMTETAHAVLALHAVGIHPGFRHRTWPAIERAAGWLSEYYNLFSMSNELYWTGKELYSPYRVDHVTTLSALVALNREQSALSERDVSSAAIGLRG